MINKTTKERLEFKDDFIKDVIEKGNRAISNEGFESQIMQKIYDITAHKKEVASRLKKSMYFFYFGLSLIGIYTMITILNKSVFYNTTYLLSIVTLFFTITIGIIVVSNYKRLLHLFSM